MKKYLVLIFTQFSRPNKLKMSSLSPLAPKLDYEKNLNIFISINQITIK